MPGPESYLIVYLINELDMRKRENQIGVAMGKVEEGEETLGVLSMEREPYNAEGRTQQNFFIIAVSLSCHHCHPWKQTLGLRVGIHIMSETDLKQK